MERDKRKKLFFLIALCIFIVGCAAWSKVGGLYSNTSALYQVDLPWGWMRYGGKDLLITRDGVFLEDITIKRTNVNEKLAHTKKKYLKGMLAEEVAEIMLDDIKGDPEMHNFELIENVPAAIGGQSGFKVTYTFRNKDGLKYKCVYYGFTYQEWVYGLSYSATADYYFAKHLQEFEKVIESFRFLGDGSR